MDVLLTSHDLCRHFNISDATLRRLRAAGLPVIVVAPHSHRYDMEAVRAWMSR